jgi:hypothetical protein
VIGKPISSKVGSSAAAPVPFNMRIVIAVIENSLFMINLFGFRASPLAQHSL